MFGKRNRERLEALEDMVVESRYEIAKLKDELASLKHCKCTCKKDAPKRRGRPLGSKNKPKAKRPLDNK